MPLKRGKFSARFPAGRIKKIMQVDKEVGKVSATVPPVVSRALELFVENLVCNSFELAKKNNLTKTISVSHLKYVIESDAKFAFARKLVENVQQLQMKSHPSQQAEDGEEAIVEKKRRGRKPKRHLALPGNELEDEDSQPKKRKYVRRNPTTGAAAAAAAAATSAAATSTASQQSRKRPRHQLSHVSLHYHLHHHDESVSSIDSDDDEEEEEDEEDDEEEEDGEDEDDD